MCTDWPKWLEKRVLEKRVLMTQEQKAEHGLTWPLIISICVCMNTYFLFHPNQIAKDFRSKCIVFGPYNRKGGTLTWCVICSKEGTNPKQAGKKQSPQGIKCTANWHLHGWAWVWSSFFLQTSCCPPKKKKTGKILKWKHIFLPLFLLTYFHHIIGQMTVTLQIFNMVYPKP